MVDSDTFAPDWISPPVATIATILDELGIPRDEFARKVMKSPSEIERLLDGRAVITPDIAQQLTVVLGASESFWTKRELQYRTRFARLQHESSQRETLDWLKEVPTKDMVKRGWLQPHNDTMAMAAACLQFFGVPSVKACAKPIRTCWPQLPSERQRHLHPIRRLLRHGYARAKLRRET